METFINYHIQYRAVGSKKGTPWMRVNDSREFNNLEEATDFLNTYREHDKLSLKLFPFHASKEFRIFKRTIILEVVE